MKRFALLVSGALLLSFTALVVPSALAASSKAINFETYSTGTIEGQDSPPWTGSGVPISPAYDQEVVTNPGVTGFDTQSFRMSNAVTSTEFALWPYSPSLTEQAGETDALDGGFSSGTRQPHFEAQWDVASMVPGAEQPGLQIAVSPDRGDGARMSFIRMRDTNAGLAIDFSDYQDVGTLGSVGNEINGCSGSDNFVTTPVANGLNRAVPHTIKLTMDLLDGPHNDVARVYVDGNLVHTGTSWEDYYRWCAESNPNPSAANDQSRTVDSLLFRAGSSSGTAVGTLGNGFLFDNLSYSSGPVPKCTQTGFFRDGINMTAAQIGGNVTGTLDATGCNIGVYYNSTYTGNVTGANIFGANYFGVAVNGDAGAVAVNVTGSTIHDIGETPLNGTQHGNAIYYRALSTGAAASGNISGNTLTNYQKGGITANGNVTVTVSNNTVTGQGAVNYIAQNGIQLGYGAKGSVTGNTVTGNAYSGSNQASSTGILVVGGPCFGTGLAYTTGLSITKNTLTNNDVGVWLFNANAACKQGNVKTKNTVKLNTATNDAVTNTTGYTAVCGYQVGIADAGHTDTIGSNSISGFGYQPQGSDCSGTPPAYLRHIDLNSTARGAGSTK